MQQHVKCGRIFFVEVLKGFLKRFFVNLMKGFDIFFRLKKRIHIYGNFGPKLTPSRVFLLTLFKLSENILASFISHCKQIILVCITIILFHYRSQSHNVECTLCMKMQLHAGGYALFYVPRSPSVLVMNFASFDHIYYPTLQPSTTAALLCLKFSVSLSFPTLNIGETKTKKWETYICTFYNFQQSFLLTHKGMVNIILVEFSHH